MAGPESRIVGRFLALARAQGWLAWKEHGNAYSGPGRLDVTVCAAGVFVAVEFKSATGRVTATQADFIQRIRRAGGYAFVARDAYLAIRATTLCTRGVTPYMQEELELTAEQQKYLDEFEAQLAGEAPQRPTIITVESPDQFARPFAPADDYLSVDAVDDESDYRQSLEQHAAAEADGTLTRRTRKPRASKIDAEPQYAQTVGDNPSFAQLIQMLHAQGDRIARLHEEIVGLRRDLDGPLILSRVQR